jgi:hypothetical protein
MDVRDIAACLYRINHQGGFKKATPDQVVNLGFAAIGAIPEIGSVFKTVFRPLWRERHLAKSAVNGGVQAIEAMLGMRKGGAIQWIRKELLGKWATRTEQAIAQVNAALDACIAMTEFLATAGGWKRWLIPAGIQALAAELLPGLRGMRADVDSTMHMASGEIRHFLGDLLGEQAAEIDMAAGNKAVAASAVAGSRSKARSAHNAADPNTRANALPTQGRKKTKDQDTSNTAKGAGSSHNALQRTRQVFGRMAVVTFESTGAVDHAQSLSELELGVPVGEALAHATHGVQRVWIKREIDRIARVKEVRLASKTAGTAAEQPKASKPVKKVK